MPSQRPLHDGLQPEIPILARTKPTVNRLQISVPLEVDQGRVDGGRFDLLLAAKLRRGVEANDLGRDKADAKKKNKGDVVPDQTNYCVGYLKDGMAFSACSAPAKI